MFALRKKFFLLILLLFYISPLVAKKSPFVDLSTPPPGFEQLSLKQRLRVSVLFTNQPIGYYFIEISGNRLKFDEPKAILSRIPNINNEKELLKRLSQSFALNVDCAENNESSRCRNLDLQPAYLIYDPKKEEVRLFISRVFFKKPLIEDDLEYMQKPDPILSYTNKFGITGTASSHLTLDQIYNFTAPYYNLYSNNTLARGDTRLNVDLTQNQGLNDGQHFQIINLNLQRIELDKIYSAGFILNKTSPFIQSQMLAGIGMETTLNTVTNQDRVAASPLVLFIREASQVNIFKNDKLIYTDYLRAGYQTIDTRNFPAGGYNLIIKIGDNVTEQFFTKGLVLPPTQAPQYYLMAGFLTNQLIDRRNYYQYLPRVFKVPVLQGGVNKRIFENVAIFNDLVINSHQAYFDLGSTFFLRGALFRLAGLITTKGTLGVNAFFSTQNEQFNLNLLSSKIAYHKRDYTNFFLDNLTDNHSISLGYSLSEKDLLGIHGGYTKRINEFRYPYGIGAFFQHRILTFDGASLFLNASFNRTMNEGNTFFLNLSLQFGKGRLAGGEALLWQNQGPHFYNNQIARPAVAQGYTMYSDQDDVGLGYAVNEMHTFSEKIQSLTGLYNYTAEEAFLSTYFNVNRIPHEPGKINWGGSAETEFAWNAAGMNFNGLRRGDSAGIIARVDVKENESQNAKFYLINEHNRKLAVLYPNENTFVPLPGYTDQNLTLINSSNADYKISMPSRHFSLYPGNISYQTWTSEKHLIVIGRLKGKNGRQLVNTWIHYNEDGIYTDELGYFQLELPTHAKKISSMDEERRCDIKLPHLNASKTYSYLGDVVCK